MIPPKEEDEDVELENNGEDDENISVQGNSDDEPDWAEDDDDDAVLVDLAAPSNKVFPFPSQSSLLRINPYKLFLKVTPMS